MASLIDPTKPIFGTPTTQSVRENFAAAKAEIEALQGDVATLEGDSIAQQTAIDGKAAFAHNHALSDLSQSAATVGQVATWDGVAWVPQTPAVSGASPGAVPLQDRFLVGGAVAGNNFPLGAAPLNGVAIISLNGGMQHEYSIAGEVLILTEDAFAGDNVLVTYWAEPPPPPAPTPSYTASSFRIFIPNAGKGIPGYYAFLGDVRFKSGSVTYPQSLAPTSVTASSYIGFYAPTLSTDITGNNPAPWLAYPGDSDEWLQADFPTSISIEGLTLRCPNTTSWDSYMPTGFTLYASNTGLFAGEEVAIVSVSGTAPWALMEARYFPVSVTN